MAGDAGSVHGGPAGWVDAPSHSQQRGFVEFWTVHVLEHSPRRGATGAPRADVLGVAAAAGVRGPGIGARRAGHRHQAEVVVCYRPALELVAAAVRFSNGDVRGGAAENLEQHARGDEPRAAPTVTAEGAHGRPI